MSDLPPVPIIPPENGDPNGRKQGNQDLITGRFLPGNQASVGFGRPRKERDLTPLEKLAHENLPEAFGILLAIMRNEKNRSSARVDAIREILNRAEGKPKQSVESDITSTLTVNVIR